MARKKIQMTLDPDSIQAAIDKLEEYKRSLNDKAQQIRQKVAETIAWSAESGFNGAVVDDILTVNGVPAAAREAHVTVDVNNQGDVTVVIAHGQDAVFVEFGAGVYHNGSVGTSPNPYGQDLGFTIGSYGVHGKQNVWYYKSDEGLVRTHGTPAAMPMYDGVQLAVRQLESIAKEVFRT